MKLKVLSWNIWISGNFSQTASFLKNSKADIVGLQEVLADDPTRDIISFLEKLGYQYIFAPVEKEWDGKIRSDGPAIFSKYKIVERETYVLSQKEQRVAVRAALNIGGKALQVFNTHLVHTHQQQLEEQDRQADSLVGVLPAKNAVLMGDFNATPDSHVIRRIKNVLVDSDPKSSPTWCVYPEGCLVCNLKKVDTRLDYIFTSKDIKTSSFKVEKSKASDHLPISVVIEV